jgi:hypothetical protein
MLIAFEIICGIVLGIMLYKFYKKQKRKRFVSSWQVGDVIFLKKKVELDNNSLKQLKIVGWNLHNVFVEFSDNIYVIYYDLIDYNKSDIWRKHYKDCEKTMGQKPSFNPVIKLVYKNKQGSKIDGKPIELMTEIECQIYLKQCLEKEDYETAELIRKQMEKYR